MQLSVLAIVFAAACSAAPHVQNGHQNRKHHRRALLHEDMLALYVQPSSTSTSSAAQATPTTSSSGAHGPYAAGELHGGNVLAVVDPSATTSSDAAAATETGWTIAAASRNITMYAHSYYNGTETIDSDTDGSSDGSEDATTGDDNQEAPSSKTSGVPAWAIALVTVFAVLSASGLVIFFFLRHKKSLNKDASIEKEVPKTDEDDALSSYKAFWELKRQSAGSFVSADATPAAVASDSIATSILRTDSLPLYEARESPSDASDNTTSAVTPSVERSPPRGFLYQ